MKQQWDNAMAEAHQGTEGTVEGKRDAGIERGDLVEVAALGIALIGQHLKISDNVVVRVL